MYKKNGIWPSAQQSAFSEHLHFAWHRAGFEGDPNMPLTNSHSVGKQTRSFGLYISGAPTIYQTLLNILATRAIFKIFIKGTESGRMLWWGLGSCWISGRSGGIQRRGQDGRDIGRDSGYLPTSTEVFQYFNIWENRMSRYQ